MTSSTDITQYCTVWLWYMRKRINHWCSVVPEKSQPSGPPFSGKLGKPRFPLERWALGLGFFCPHWTPMMDPIYLTYPVPTSRKDKNLTVTQHRTSVRIHCFVKLSSSCHDASQCIQELQRAPFKHKIYLMMSKKKNPLFMWGWDRKISP